jgi:hypothetical protein
MARNSATALKVVPAAPKSVAPKAPRAPKAPAHADGVIAQLRLAALPENRLALVVGALLGGLVPFVAFVLAHFEIDPTVPLYAQLPAWLVLGGLVYSAKSVYQWGVAAFACPFKAIGFVLLTEGTMLASHYLWLSLVVLAYLIAVNAVNTGVHLALQRK